MHASLVPTANDLAGMVTYFLGNPYLFISSSTVMTTGLVLGAVAVSMVPRSAPLMRVVAPPLAMLLVYFGVGSIVLPKCDASPRTRAGQCQCRAPGAGTEDRDVVESHAVPEQLPDPTLRRAPGFSRRH